MPRPLRFIAPHMVVEVTVRTIQRRLLLKPSAELNELVLGVLGRALQRYEVDLHACAVLSNHVHLLVSPGNAAELARFMQYFNSNVSREVGRLHGWSGSLWGRRYRAIPVVDEESQVARMRYVLAQGCKEGLVGSPLEWPGASSTRALVEGSPLFGTWVDRTAMYESRRAGGQVDRRAFETRYEVPLTPLPCWARLSAEEYRRRCGELVEDIESETAERNAERGRRPVGAAFVLAQDPHGAPRGANRSPAPMVHATTKLAREAYLSAYRRFVDAFRRAAQRLLLGYDEPDFPLHSFPPALPFVMRT